METPTLNLTYSCEIGNLLDVLAFLTGKSYSEVEKQAFDEYLYPENTKVFVTTRFPKDEEDDEAPGTLRAALFDLMIDKGIVDMDITLSI